MPDGNRSRQVRVGLDRQLNLRYSPCSFGHLTRPNYRDARQRNAHLRPRNALILRAVAEPVKAKPQARDNRGLDRTTPTALIQLRRILI